MTARDGQKQHGSQAPAAEAERHVTGILESVAREFTLPGAFAGGTRYGSGHIHATYAVDVRANGTPERFIFQRINEHIFKDIPALMENIARVLEHVGRTRPAGASARDERVLSLVPTRDGRLWMRDASGAPWRVYTFVDRASTYDVARDAGMAREAARAYGAFQRRLADLPPPRLHETIPGFHDTPARLAALETAVREDRQGRAGAVGAEIAFARARADAAGRLQDLLESGTLPERVTHNDTKLNNVLIDDETGRGICVIDLDTVMPGLSLYDFGDMVRSVCNSADEDEPDVEKVRFRMPFFEALVQGYLETAGGFLTQGERGELAFAGRLITLEIGVRFLTDHLNGDTYFRTHRPEQNLDRCRVQFRLVRLMETREAEMRAAVRACAG